MRLQGVTEKTLYFAWAMCTLLLTGTALADATQIFNKNRRTLNPPQRNLKTSNENFKERVESESERFHRVPADSTTPQGTNGAEKSAQKSNSTEDSLVITTQPVSAPAVTNTSGRSTRKVARRGTRQFDGERIFGIGIVGAGSYGIYGTELEFAFDEQTTFAVGLGTGMSFSTWGFHGRRFFNSSGRLSTFMEAGYANWYMGKSPTQPRESVGNYLAYRFFFENSDVQQRKRVDILYPSIGVMGHFKSGLALSAQLQYMVALHDFSGGLYGSAGLYFYF